MGVLSKLQPEGVFRFFEEISGIPRGSYHEKEISDYLVSFAKERGFECWQDDIYNVVMKIPGSNGRENESPLIMQGHTDMVCEKAEGSNKDMEKEGLDLAIDGDYVYAKGTTLGGDDGIAVAYMLAIADDKSISHPPLEYIFTVAEEVGMDGATAIDLSMLKGNQMLNLDSEEEGIFLCSCAGGLSTESKVPVQRHDSDMLVWLQISIEGLLGGHSGCEIHKERANATLLLARVLAFLSKKVSFSLSAFEGGKKDNVIPAFATCEIGVKDEDVDCVKSVCHKIQDVYKNEYMGSDPNVGISLKEITKESRKCLCLEDRDKVLSLLNTLPNGVQAMSTSVNGLVETSLNLGITILEQDTLCLRHSVRSSVTSRKYHIADKVRTLVEVFGGTVEIQGEYPAWEYKAESVVRDKVMRLYKQIYEKDARMEGIHAGLECGLLAGKIPNLDCVSMGPDILDIHTASERLSISSTKRVYEFLIEYLKLQ